MILYIKKNDSELLKIFILLLELYAVDWLNFQKYCIYPNIYIIILVFNYYNNICLHY